MDEQTKRKMILNYFKPFPKWAIWMIVIGVVVLLIGIGAGVGAILVGIVIAGIGGFGIYSYGQGKPTDQQMDEWLEEDLKGMEKKALSKTGTDETELISESVQVTGPRFWNVGGAEVFFKKGKDNVLRFTPVGVTVLNFTPNQLVAYQCALDLSTGNPLNESTDEYFYKDVVSVSTQSKSLTWDQATLATKGLLKGPLGALVTAGKLQLNSAETFVLTTSGGTSVEVVLKDPALIEKMGGGVIPTTRAEKAIQTVRKMLREKKA